MPNQPKTQHRSVRIDEDDWRDLGADAEARGLDRARIINAYIRYHLGRPDAELPERAPKPKRARRARSS